MKPTSPFSAQTLLSLGAKQARSDPSYNAAKPLCEVNRCAAHTALRRLAPKQYKAESVVQRLISCMDGRHERSAKLELRSSAKWRLGWGYWMKQKGKKDWTQTPTAFRVERKWNQLFYFACYPSAYTLQDTQAEYTKLLSGYQLIE